MTKITTDFVASDDGSVRKRKVQDLHRFWQGGTALNAGVARQGLNDIAVSDINLMEHYSTWMAKANALNDPDALLSAIPDLEAYFCTTREGTMFQTSTGGLPADDATEPVGLILVNDIEEFSLGSDIASGWNFTTWTDSGSVTSKTANSFTVTGAGGVYTAFPALKINTNYLVRVAGTWSFSPDFILRNANNGVGAIYFPISGTSDRYYIFNTDHPSLFFATSAGGSATITAFEIREILNPGVLLTQASAGLRPTVVRHPVTGVRNLCTSSDGDTAWDGKGTNPPTVGLSQTHLGEMCAAITFAASTPAGFAASRADRASYSGGVFDIIAGEKYRSFFDISLSRPLAGGEQIVIYATGVFGICDLALTAANTSGLTGVWTRLSGFQDVAAPTSGQVYPVVFCSGDIGGSPVTVYIKKLQFLNQTSEVEPPYQRVGATSADVTEAGVDSVTGIRMDQTTQKMSFTVPAERNRVYYPNLFTADPWFGQNVTVSGSQATFPTGTGADFLRIQDASLVLGSVAQTLSFKARSISGDATLQVDCGNFETTTFELTGSLATYTWTVTPAANRAWLDFCTVNAGVIELADVQWETGAVATAFEGDVVGTMILAGAGGTWAETIRTPRRIAYDLGPSTVAGSAINSGLIAAVQGPLTNPNNKLLGFMVFDRVLSDGEIRRIARRFKAVGGAGWLVPGPELVTNGNFSGGLTGWTTTDPTWTVTSGRATLASTVVGGSSNSQDLSLPDGLYLWGCNTDTLGGGAVGYVSIPGDPIFLPVSGDRTALRFSKSSAAFTGFLFEANSAFTGSFDNASVRKYSPEF